MRANVLYEEEIKLKTSFSKTNYKSQLTKDTSSSNAMESLTNFLHFLSWILLIFYGNMQRTHYEVLKEIKQDYK